MNLDSDAKINSYFINRENYTNSLHLIIQLMSDHLKELSLCTSSGSLNKACISRLMLLFKTSSKADLVSANFTGQCSSAVGIAAEVVERPSSIGQWSWACGVAAGVVECPSTGPGLAPVGGSTCNVVSQEEDVATEAASDATMTLDVTSMNSGAEVTLWEVVCTTTDPGVDGNPSEFETLPPAPLGQAVEGCLSELPSCEEARQQHRSPPKLEEAKQPQRSPPKPPTRRGWHAATISLKLVGCCEG